MKLVELLEGTAKIIESQKIIDHGSIRCLFSIEACNYIMQAEGCSKVYLNTIGDDKLANELLKLTIMPEKLMSIDTDDLISFLCEVNNAYYGDEIENYLARDEEDELQRLEALITTVQEHIHVLRPK